MNDLTLPAAWQEFVLFEPRWHGWACWEFAWCQPTSRHTYFRDVLAKGWTRRRRGSQYVQMKAEVASRPSPGEDAQTHGASGS